MALTLDSNGSSGLSAGANTLAAVTGPHTFVAVLSTVNCDGCVLEYVWRFQTQAAADGHVIETETVAVSSGVDGHVTAPVPIYTTGLFVVNLVSGSPTGALHWDIYMIQ